MKKYIFGFIILSVILAFSPALAEENLSSTTSSSATGTVKLTDQQKILEAQRKLEVRFQAAKLKLQERLTKLQTRQVNETVAVACVGIAVGTRETAIANAFRDFSTAQSAALSTRASGLSVAWSSPSSTPKQIKTNVNGVWAAYHKAHKTAVRSHNASTTAAWSAFKKASVACKASQSGVSVDARSYGSDSVQ